MSNNGFRSNNVICTRINKPKNPCQRRESKPGPQAPQSDALQLRQLNVLIIGNLFNCFNVMCQNINRFSGHSFLTNLSSVFFVLM